MRLDQIDLMMREAVADKTFPGGALLFSRSGEILFNRVYGVADIATGRPVAHQTYFDLASLTKPLATTLAILVLIHQRKLDLDREISAVIPEFSENEKTSIRIRHLLCHQSGLPDYRPYYLEIGKLPFPERKKALQQYLVREPLVSPPARQTIYSDIGFMILQWIVEAVSGIPLDRFVYRHVYGPLGIDDLFYLHTDTETPGPDMETSGPDVSGLEFAATENCPWRGYTIKGAVHDENAFVMGGTAAHAGLFGTAASVHRLLSALMAADAAYTEHPASGVERVLDSTLVRTFLSRQEHCERALGFDMPSAAGSSSGDFFNRDFTFGHLGFTGTSFWMDLSRFVIVILLTNRIHPSRANEGIRIFRPRIHNAVMQCIHQSAKGG